MNITDSIAPPLQVSQWLNASQPVTLDGLRGRVVVLHAFQMLCPGCVSHGLPQALRIHRLFPPAKVAVIGLHTVFEHHQVMGPLALRVFLDEYRIPFPVGVDQAHPDSPVPITMQAFGLRGTPSVVVIDQAGRVRLSRFGQIEDLELGAVIGKFLADAPSHPMGDGVSPPADLAGASACAGGVCSVEG